jgi:two-component sensor histidine kinase
MVTAIGESRSLTNDQIISALNDFSDGFFALDESLVVGYMNPAAEHSLGLAPGEAVGKTFGAAVPTSKDSVFGYAFQRCLAESSRLDFQTYFGSGSGAHWYDIRVSPADRGLSVRLRVLGDDSEAARNETLIRELSHRVKNSLAMISSLAEIELGAVEDECARESMKRLQGRIHATSLLYDKLSRTPGAMSIDMAEYLSDLAALVAENFSSDDRRIAFELELANLSLDPARAAALGLAANEAMTNSFKYAFSGGASGGRLRIRLSASKGIALFAVEDDGPGFPELFDPARDGDIGFALMSDKARELGGRLSTGRGAGGRGARIQISFPC